MRGRKNVKSMKGTKSAKGAKSKKLMFKKNLRDYLAGKVKLTRAQKVGVVLMIVVLAGFIGWVWEFILAEFEGHFQHLYIKGGNLLPWMNIYAYGALLIMLLTYRLRKYPWAVFAVAAIGCGILELFAGWIVYTVGNGTRYWDYSNSAIGWGNINGFVCPMSAVAFGIGGLGLMYGLLPLVIKWARSMSQRTFLAMAVTIFTIVMIDDLTNLTLKNLGLPTAQNLYKSWGWVYK